MTAEGLYTRLRGRPFTPFRLHLSGGTSFDVMHPEMTLMSKSGITLAIHEPGQSSDEVPGREVYISHLHATSAEDLPAAARAAG